MRPPSTHRLLSFLSELAPAEVEPACSRGESWCAHIAQQRFKLRGTPVLVPPPDPTMWRYGDTSFIDWERTMHMLRAIGVAARGAP